MTASGVLDLARAGKSLAVLPWPVIDAHAHLGPTGGFYIPSPSAADMLRVMDRLGIAMTGLSPHLAICADAERGNALAARTVAENPRRFFAYATVNPRYPDALTVELDGWLDVPGMLGIKLHPTLSDFLITDACCDPVWRMAEERRTPILIHTWEGDARCSPQAVAEVAKAHPEVILLMGHSGGTSKGRRDACGVAADHANLFLELCGSTVTGAEIAMMVHAVGADRVVFGTDAPWIDPRYMLGKIAWAGLGDDALRLILGGNAARLFHLSI